MGDKPYNSQGQSSIYTAGKIGLAMLTGLAGGLESRVTPANAQGLTPVSLPNISAATPLGPAQNQDIIPEIPGKESTVTFYRTSEGNYFSTMQIANKKGELRTYGFSIDTNGGAPWEYMLVDLNGDGNFEKVPAGPIQSSGWISNYVKQG